MQSRARVKKAKSTKKMKQRQKVEKEDKAAVKMQSGARMKKAKSEKAVLKQAKQENDAATVVQAGARAKWATRLYERPRSTPGVATRPASTTSGYQKVILHSNGFAMLQGVGR